MTTPFAPTLFQPRAAFDRRQERSERQHEHIGELNRRAAESEARLKRRYNAIEAGVADLNDPALKDRIVGLKAIRNQAKAWRRGCLHPHRKCFVKTKTYFPHQHATHKITYSQPSSNSASVS